MSYLFLFLLLKFSLGEIQYHLPGDVSWFSIVVLPDTQYYTAWDNDIFEEQTYWACECQERLNTVFVSQLGDLVNRESHLKEWRAARVALDKLSSCELTYAVLPGNHDTEDYAGATDYTNFDHYFSAASLGADGSYPLGSAHNTYFLFTISNKEGWSVNYLFLQLEYLPSAENATAVLNWASSVLTNYSSYTAVVSTHFAASDCASATIYPSLLTLLQQHCNILFILSGHNFACGGENNVYYNNTCSGKTVQQWVFVTDFQGRDNGGNGWLRVYNFSYPAHGQGGFSVCANTFSPTLDSLENTTLGNFSLSYPGGTMEAGCDSFEPCRSTYASPVFFLFSLSMIFSLFVILLMLGF